MEIYLDNSATTRIRPEVLKEVIDICDVNYGNPSSLHRKGLEIEKRIDEARSAAATVISSSAKEIYFTGGGTESNNIAIFGHLDRALDGLNIVTTVLEHPSVYNVYRHFESVAEIRYLDSDSSGNISFEQLKECVDEHTVLVSIMMVNNEIGSLQDVDAISKAVKKINPKTRIHIDAIQAFGKIKIDVRRTPLDTVSFSSHKVHGPKGVGGLYIRKGCRLSPIAFGGSQEMGIRPGTENTPGIVGFGKACELLMQDFAGEADRLYSLREAYAQRIKEEIPDVKINGPAGREGAPHILSLSFKDVKGEVLVHCLESYGIYVSTGSACSSKSKNENRILKSIGLDPNYAEGTVRLSFGYFNSMEELNYTVEKLKESVGYIRSIVK